MVRYQGREEFDMVLPGEKPVVIDSGDIIEMRDCGRCRGTGEEPHHPSPENKVASGVEIRPIGVSQWKAIGQKYHYDKYFGIVWPK